mmetsp:Transcript_14784/g.28992  ORF Transcript_14784/g.28992 Transcript_14784/m.28992 type:complete len:206 (+) Transcript_14784:1218-1835(+)
MSVASWLQQGERLLASASRFAFRNHNTWFAKVMAGFSRGAVICSSWCRGPGRLRQPAMRSSSIFPPSFVVPPMDIDSLTSPSSCRNTLARWFFMGLRDELVEASPIANMSLALATIISSSSSSASRSQTHQYPFLRRTPHLFLSVNSFFPLPLMRTWVPGAIFVVTWTWEMRRDPAFTSSHSSAFGTVSRISMLEFSRTRDLFPP